VALAPAPTTGRFARTAHVARKERAEKLARAVFAAMAAAMVVPLLLIVGYLVWLAWPTLSLEFILDVPRRGMTDGGIEGLGAGDPDRDLGRAQWTKVTPRCRRQPPASRMSSLLRSRIHRVVPLWANGMRLYIEPRHIITCYLLSPSIIRFV